MLYPGPANILPPRNIVLHTFTANIHSLSFFFFFFLDISVHIGYLFGHMYYFPGFMIATIHNVSGLKELVDPQILSTCIDIKIMFLGTVFLDLRPFLGTGGHLRYHRESEDTV